MSMTAAGALAFVHFCLMADKMDLSTCDSHIRTDALQAGDKVLLMGAPKFSFILREWQIFNF